MAWTKEAREKAKLSKQKNGITNQFSKAKKEGLQIPEAYNKGKPNPNWKPHTEETIQILREKALASPHRRLKRKMIEYKGVLLDSSWELELAKSLDENNIKWVRPEPLKWLDENNLEHNYFPDFYLPEYDIFVDPKNKHAFNVQKHKIEQLKKQFTNIVFLVNIEEVRQFALMVKQDITRVV